MEFAVGICGGGERAGRVLRLGGRMGWIVARERGVCVVGRRRWLGLRRGGRHIGRAGGRGQQGRREWQAGDVRCTYATSAQKHCRLRRLRRLQFRLRRRTGELTWGGGG